jgi:hypothetical protein
MRLTETTAALGRLSGRTAIVSEASAPLVMPSLHLRSTYSSHTNPDRPTRWETITGRHANQRCQYMLDGKMLVGIVS